MNRATVETVLITGASSGIGLELAKCFAAEKSNLVLVARSTEALEKLAAELRAQFQIQVVVLTADLAKPESPQWIFDEAGRAGIAVDVLVNNAGFGLQGMFNELPLARQMEILQVNQTALTALTGLFLPGMIQRNRGGILNVGSIAGFQPGPAMALYFASKAYVQSFTEALAAELSDTQLHVSVLCPGPTSTNFGKVARGGKVRRRKLPGMSAEAVAKYGCEKFRSRRVVIVPGWGNKMSVFIVRFIPRSLLRKLVKYFNTQIYNPE
ncbi:MAG TPA: SDR family oxidoreductase [bacterium]|nr:SDR family oxidoreductase [bacterium]